MSRATCHDPAGVGCANAGIEIDNLDLTYRDEQGRVQQITTVICGVCGQPITDIKR